ncbi:MAG: hypothetical protein M9928_14070 [Anaerolineae bacterium]|nr:hypothetical protein [Anaerolineae bacterium]
MLLQKRVLLLLVTLTSLLIVTVAMTTADGGPDLARISEETGLVASLTAVSADCVFDGDYGVYLCPEAESDVLPVQDPVAHAQAVARLVDGGLLLIPDSTDDRVMAFDPMTGDLIDPDYIPADPDNLSTPIEAILSASGMSILVSDQIDDVVQEYDLDGNYIGVFAPAGGADTSILDNIRGIALRDNGNLLVSVASGSNSNAIAEFDTAGNYLGNFVANGDGGLNSPFDVAPRPTDWMVPGINSDAVHLYDLVGNYVSDLTAVNTFPEQAAEIPNTNVLVANFSGDSGVLEYLADGTFVGLYDVVTGNRGVYELPNGNILTTNGSGVYEIDRAGALVDTKISDVSARFITHIVMDEPPTAIELVAFDAAVNADGSVTLTWETAAEVANAGFHIYRSADATATLDSATRVSAEMIAANGSAGAGASYSFTDTPAAGVWYYFLADIATDGATGWHGPAQAVTQAPTSAALTAFDGGNSTLLTTVLLLFLILAAMGSTAVTIRRRN